MIKAIVTISIEVPMTVDEYAAFLKATHEQGHQAFVGVENTEFGLFHAKTPPRLDIRFIDTTTHGGWAR
jgi:hypothetical protein